MESLSPRHFYPYPGSKRRRGKYTLFSESSKRVGKSDNLVVKIYPFASIKRITLWREIGYCVPTQKKATMGSKSRTLREHSRHVAEMCAKACRSIGIENLGYLTGLLHDSGKASEKSGASEGQNKGKNKPFCRRDALAVGTVCRQRRILSTGG